MSLRVLASPPRTCSGAMKLGVPTMALLVVFSSMTSGELPAGLPPGPAFNTGGNAPLMASPQSSTRTSPYSPIMTLLGLRSR